MKALISGGAGFLGSALANRLAAEGHAVYVLDDLSAGDNRLLDERVMFTRGDVRDIPRLWALLDGADVVYHLAAKVSVPESVRYPVEYNLVNTGGAVSLMTAVRDAGVRRVVFASSATVYGAQEEQPVTEASPPRPPNPYGVSKLAAEHYVRAIGELYRIETVVLRIFNAYGPGQTVPAAHPPVIPHFLRQLKSGGSLVLHGVPPGSQTRDFVYVSDVVAALARAGEVAGLAGMTMNIGSGTETSLHALVRELERLTGRTARVIESPEQTGGVARLAADVSAAKRVLDWTPVVTLADGLARTARALGLDVH